MEEKNTESNDANYLYALYMTYVISVMSEFKTKVIDIVKDHDDLYQQIFHVIPCNIDVLAIQINAVKLFKPDLFNDKISNKANFENMMHHLNDHFFNKTYTIENGKLCFTE